MVVRGWQVRYMLAIVKGSDVNAKIQYKFSAMVNKVCPFSLDSERNIVVYRFSNQGLTTIVKLLYLCTKCNM